MTTARIKKTGPILQSRSDMEGCVGRICTLTIEQDALTAAMDLQLVQIREGYEERLGDIAVELKNEMLAAEDWSAHNPDQFGAKKSIEFVHGAAGYRTGMPQCKPLKGWTWEKVKANLLAHAWGFIREITQVDKDSLIAAREVLGPQGLAERGVQVVQEESFFVEPKRETVEAKQ